MDNLSVWNGDGNVWICIVSWPLFFMFWSVTEEQHEFLNSYFVTTKNRVLNL